MKFSIEKLSLIAAFANSAIRDLNRGHATTSRNVTDAVGFLGEELKELLVYAKREIENDPENVVAFCRNKVESGEN